MALVKCKECGHQVSTTAKACPNCGAKAPTPVNVRAVGCLLFIIIGLLFLINHEINMSKPEYKAPEVQAPIPRSIPSVTPAQPAQPAQSLPPEQPKQPANTLISYKIVQQWTPGVDGVGMRIVVDPSSTKEQVMALANDLKEKNSGKGHVEIHIFDDAVAARNQTNPNYPDNELLKHYLVIVRLNPATGFESVSWMPDEK